LTKQELTDTVISQIKEGNSERINSHLRDNYLSNFNKAVDGVMGKPGYGDSGFDLALQSRLNVERFANFKSYQATEQLKSLKTDDPKFEDNAKSVINTFNRFQATEYNTITARARSAHQWEGFKENKDLYPNIMWLPSRSAHIREEHAAFYFHVWPQDDPFWDENSPGSLWNCKCDWEETDKDVTDNGDIDSVPASPGLEGNPGEIGELITDEHPYISSVSDKMNEEITDDIMRDVRDRSVSLGFENLLDKMVQQTIVENEVEKTIEIGFNKRGINHFAHDFAENPNFKNSLIPELDKITKNATYELSAKDSKSNPMVKAFHYYSFDLSGQTVYLNVRELITGKFNLYALTNAIK